MKTLTAWMILCALAGTAAADPKLYVLSRTTLAGQLDVFDGDDLVQRLGVSRRNWYLEVDSDHQRVYMSGDTSDFIETLDTADTAVSVIPNLTAAGALTALPDGRRLAMIDVGRSEIIL